MPQSFGMNCDDFIRSYQDALASQSWALVDPLIHNNACVTFSNGGRGTAVLVREGSDWKLLVEHLGPPPVAVA